MFVLQYCFTCARLLHNTLNSWYSTLWTYCTIYNVTICQQSLAKIYLFFVQLITEEEKELKHSRHTLLDQIQLAILSI